jgi:hypothetical protein
MVKVRKRLYLLLTAISVVLLWLNCSPQVNGRTQTSQPSNKEIQEEKRFFDFLIGEWKIERAETPEGVEIRDDDVYKFSKVIDGNGILAEWFFNRGTKAKPDYANAMYLTAFDTFSKNWSFYYISEKSAQWWEGRKENGQWVFYKEFPGEGLLQRQAWKLRDRSTVIRVIENSKDGGKSWATYQFVLKRRG